MAEGTTLRAILKRPVEILLARTGAGRAAVALRSMDLVLAYHNILPQGSVPGADRSLHLPIVRFRSHLELLVRTHRVVPLRELLETPRAPHDGPRVAITFDDAYRGAVVAGIAEVAKRGLPATIFVAPGRLGGDTFWWDSHDCGDAGVSEHFREHALHDLAGREEAVRAWARAAGISRTPVAEDARTASVEDLERAVANPGIELGSHSWDHPNLARLSQPELTQQLTTSLAWLRERFPDVILPWLAYPYGLSSPRVEAAVAEAGYHGAVRIRGGPLGTSPNRFAVPRVNVPEGLSPEGLIVRAAGFLRDE